MFTTIKQSIKGVLEKYSNPNIPIHWIMKKENSWLSQQFKSTYIRPQKSIYSRSIERLAQQTNNLGPQPLWEGYAGNNVRGPTPDA